MSQNRSKGHVTSQIHFVRTCFINSIAETLLHDKWLPVEGAAAYMNRKYNLENDTTIEKGSFIRTMNKFYPDKTSSGNTIALDDGNDVPLFRHEFKNKSTRQESIYITKKKRSPAFPTVATAASWQADNVAMLLRRVTRRNAEILSVEPPPKKQKTLPDTGKLLSASSVASPDATSLLDLGVGASDSTDSCPPSHIPVQGQNDITDSSSSAPSRRKSVMTVS